MSKFGKIKSLILLKTIIECSPTPTSTPTKTATPTPTPITTAVTEIEGKGWVHAKIN